MKFISNLKIWHIVAGFCWLIFMGSIGFYIFSELVFSGAFDSHYSKKDAVENYYNKEADIVDLYKYFDSIAPTDKDVLFGMGDCRKCYCIDVSITDSTSGLLEHYGPSGLNLKINSLEMDSTLKYIGWDITKVIKLGSKIKKTSCVNIRHLYYKEDGQKIMQIQFADNVHSSLVI